MTSSDQEYAIDPIAYAWERVNHSELPKEMQWATRVKLPTFAQLQARARTGRIQAERIKSMPSGAAMDLDYPECGL
jgi:hypothetical protein